MDFRHDLQNITQVTAGALVSEISHQLRQPLNALNLYVASAQELLNRSNADPAARKALSNAESQIQRLSSLLEGLREQLSIPQLTCVPVALAPLIRQVAATAEIPEAALKILGADNDLMVVADPLPLSCVIRQLLNSCGALNGNAAENNIRIAILPAHPVVTLEMSNGHPISSPALDLAISKRLMESQGGRLSLVDTGTPCFQLTLPAA